MWSPIQRPGSQTARAESRRRFHRFLVGRADGSERAGEPCVRRSLVSCLRRRGDWRRRKVWLWLSADRHAAVASARAFFVCPGAHRLEPGGHRGVLGAAAASGRLAGRGAPGGRRPRRLSQSPYRTKRLFHRRFARRRPDDFRPPTGRGRHLLRLSQLQAAYGGIAADRPRRRRLLALLCRRCRYGFAARSCHPGGARSRDLGRVS